MHLSVFTVLATITMVLALPAVDMASFTISGFGGIIESPISRAYVYQKCLTH